MVENKKERRKAEKLYNGKNVKIYKDFVEDETDGSKNVFFIMTLESDKEGYFRDEKGNLCYGLRPPKAITFQKDYAKEMVISLGSVK